MEAQSCLAAFVGSNSRFCCEQSFGDSRTNDRLWVDNGQANGVRKGTAMDGHDADVEQIRVGAAIFPAFYDRQTVDLAFYPTAGPGFDDHCTKSEPKPLLDADHPANGVPFARRSTVKWVFVIL